MGKILLKITTPRNTDYILLYSEYDNCLIIYKIISHKKNLVEMGRYFPRENMIAGGGPAITMEIPHDIKVNECKSMGDIHDCCRKSLLNFTRKSKVNKILSR